MNWRQQLRWAGLWIIISSALMNGLKVVVYLGYHHPTIQAIYGVGFTGLIFTCTIIHLVQAKRSGLLGLLAFLVSVLSLVYSNVVTFLILEELSGAAEARETFLAISNPVMRLAVYGSFIGLTLLGISVAQAGVFPRWSGILLAVGVAIQLPAQYAMEIAGSLFFLFAIGGSILTGSGLAWMGWALWSGRGWNPEEPGLSQLDRGWGSAFVMLTGILLGVDAAVNMFGGLSLTSGVTHLLSYTTLVLTSFLLYAAQKEHIRGTGFAGLVFTQLGAALYMIPAYLIVVQLAGLIDNNRMLMAAWQDIPIGRVGSYMSILGIFLFGIEAIRSETLPPVSGWLVIVGIALALPFLFSIQAYFLGIFWVLGAIVEGIGVCWMGWALRKQKAATQMVQLHESPT